MEKHARAYENPRKIERELAPESKSGVTAKIDRYRLKQEKEVEKILSPFWAWRALAR